MSIDERDPSLSDSTLKDIAESQLLLLGIAAFFMPLFAISVGVFAWRLRIFTAGSRGTWKSVLAVSLAALAVAIYISTGLTVFFGAAA